MFFSLNFFLFFLFPILLFSFPQKGSFSWTNREISCKNYAINQTRCVLNHPELGPEQNPECFNELHDDGTTSKVFCALGCEESLEATLLKKTPSNSRKCVQYYTYNIERRRQDWYLWRNGSCLDSTIVFNLICGTPSNPKIFYRQNEHLFLYEDFTD